MAEQREAGSSDPLDTALASTFGFDRFRDGQRAVCEALLAGRSALAVFPTGGGKSLCYQLPALLSAGTALVVSPLIALMKDQVDFLRSKGVAAARLDSSLTPDEASAVLDGLARSTLKLLYVAPERFLNERFLERLSRSKISLLAIDEAHCISQWGHNFRPDYLKLADHARRLGIHPVLALTATATPAVADDIVAAFSIAPADRVVTGFYRPNLALDLRAASGSARDEAVQAEAYDGPTIIYVTLQRTAEQVAEQLARRGVAARAYHAGLDTEVRTAVQEAFMAGEVQVVVATIAFGMGIDKADIRAVIHYNLPKSLESYAQEIGRAGRDGQPSVCRMYATRDDLAVLANFAHGDAPTRSAVAGVLGALFAGGEEVQLSIRSLADEHDMRELVVKTLLTWLELDGWLRQTTPVYTEYRWRWLREREVVLAGFDEARRDFLTRVFDLAKRGRVWDKLDLSAGAAALGEPRERLVRALDWLAEKGHLAVEASGVQQRLVVLRRPTDPGALADDAWQRFGRLEAAEVERLHGVVAFVEGEGCHTARLVGYFGEPLGRSCGHCTGCRGVPLTLPPPAGTDAWPDSAALAAVLRQHRSVMTEPRTVARFLCGIRSPALTRAKLTRHPLFGCTAEAEFGEVLARIEALPA